MPEQVPESCLESRVRPSAGLNSSGIHNTPAEAGGRKHDTDRASAIMRRRVEDIIAMSSRERIRPAMSL